MLAPIIDDLRCSARRGSLLGEPVEPQRGELCTRWVAGVGITSCQLIVRVARVLELLGRKGYSRGWPLALERLEQLLRQNVCRLPDALARIEGHLALSCFMDRRLEGRRCSPQEPATPEDAT